jgi:hypothetical protein
MFPAALSICHWFVLEAGPLQSFVLAKEQCLAHTGKLVIRGL